MDEQEIRKIKVIKCLIGTMDSCAGKDLVNPIPLCETIRCGTPELDDLPGIYPWIRDLPYHVRP